MKFQFKIQNYQTDAVDAVVDCFEGQGFDDGESYLIDPGIKAQIRTDEPDIKNFPTQLFELDEIDEDEDEDDEDEYGTGNARIHDENQVLRNIQAVQKRQYLNISDELIETPQCKFNLDVEMETGTGKTYCYIKTMFEMNKRYGWSKFIIIVPSIAIREGVYQSLKDTAEHFHETYSKKAHFFIYDSKRLQPIKDFSSGDGINVMIINIQAFNANRKNDSLRIRKKLDELQSRRPIDVISRNNPILILDEPQNIKGKATLEALIKFKPLMILRYSATHEIRHNLIYRLDALDAYEQKLVKKIEVRGIEVTGQQGIGSYLYLEKIDLTKDGPVAWVELEIKRKSGIKKEIRKVTKRDDLFALSNEMEQYSDRYTIAQIDANSDTIEFTNGIILQSGTAINDLTEDDVRRIQIRETIKAHLEKERELFNDSIKVLSLFFIDKVKKYRDYDQADQKGEYAKIFEEEYLNECQRIFDELDLTHEHRKYLEKIDVAKTHEGYFSIDKRTKQFIDSSMVSETKNTDAYDLILKDKKRLLSFAEDTRFIFSHSALREGWDNPNVFVMCMLKKYSKSETTKRQEVGRGLRLCVTQNGERVDDPATVHDINKLTVVASESYKDFAGGLQKEIRDSITSRPRRATEDYFKNKTICTDAGDEKVIDKDIARQIYFYLAQNNYSTHTGEITPEYHTAKANGELAELPEELKPFATDIFKLIDSVFSDASLPEISNARTIKTNLLNENFNCPEFQELWRRINIKAFYSVEFATSKLIDKCVDELNKKLNVKIPQYQIKRGEQKDDATEFEYKSTRPEEYASAYATTSYDLIGRIAEETNLTRQTTAKILTKIRKETFDQFKINPEHFISETTRIITNQRAKLITKGIQYNTLDERYDIDTFTKNPQNLKDTTMPLKKHVYDFAITDSDVEREFVRQLDNSEEVIVYAKLPRWFSIPTPVGDYNPDWAIALNKKHVTHIYFVAETKGSVNDRDLRLIESDKIKCAEKFFEKLNQQNRIKYEIVTDFEELRDLAQRRDSK